MDDFTHPTSTDSFSQNWLHNNTYAPFEFSYTTTESESAEQYDDQTSIGFGSFNFATTLPHLFHLTSDNDSSDDDPNFHLYADDLFLNGYIKSPALLHQNESLFIAKHEVSSPVSSSPVSSSSVSSYPVSVMKCRVLRKWGKCVKNVVIKCWKVVECGFKLEKKVMMCRSDLRGWSSGGDFGYVNGCVENPIYEAVLHCKRSSMGDYC